MREPLRNVVISVIAEAVRIKQRLERGEEPDLAEAQATLKQLLLNDAEAHQWADYGGDADRDNSGAQADDAERGADDAFLGIRYALVCWIDELFILYSPWKEDWNEQKLEVDLYGSNDRAWRFWEQAKRAEQRKLLDALEVFFLCVMLGFRGELRESRDKLRAWVQEAKGRHARIRGQEWSYSLDVVPPTRVPPLRGREQFQRMAGAAGAVVLFVLPILSFLVVYYLGR